MRSHERTMIASLGFSDPDLESEEHDAACIYLAQPEKMNVLKSLVFSPESTQGRTVHEIHKRSAEACSQCHVQGYRYFGIEYRGLNFDLHKIVMEKPITKGDGQYKSVIGFIDVSGEFAQRYDNLRIMEEVFRSSDGRSYSPRSFCSKCDDASYMPFDSLHRDSRWVKTNRSVRGLQFDLKPMTLAVEVKVKRETVTTVLRQIGLYRAFVGEAHWLLATTYRMTGREADVLRAHDITPVHLGLQFTNWRKNFALESDPSRTDVPSKPVYEV